MISRSQKTIIAIILVASAGGLFIMFGPPKLMAKTETPDFCASCHVMESQFEAWFHTGAHRSIRCIDCHLPQENIGAYYTWKSIDGMKDVFIFYSGRVPETIRLSAHGERTVRSNCTRCHETIVDKIDRTRNCWECHRRLQHSLAGTRLTKQ
ncbi:MAG: cytochrome c nitrite reductase small subunit [Desulfobacteraceae bacterium]|nr:MAG: cytochrome c nitrite reductase small subunit [Desulfobacteraceae bacterium]